MRNLKHFKTINFFLLALSFAVTAIIVITSLL